jgi:hypothetical protein
MTAFYFTTNGIPLIRQPAAESFSSVPPCPGGLMPADLNPWKSFPHDLSYLCLAVRGEGTSGSHPAPGEETEPDMSTAQISSNPSILSAAAKRQPLWRHGVAAAVLASIATTGLAAAASAGGVSFTDRADKSIPIAGFAQMTLLFSLVGIAIAAVMARKVRRPRVTFVRTAVMLTGLSFVPDRVRRQFGCRLDRAAHRRRGDRGSDPGEAVRAHPLSNWTELVRSGSAEGAAGRTRYHGGRFRLCRPTIPKDVGGPQLCGGCGSRRSPNSCLVRTAPPKSRRPNKREGPPRNS